MQPGGSAVSCGTVLTLNVKEEEFSVKFLKLNSFFFKIQ